MHVMNIIMTLSSVMNVEKSSSMKPIGFITREKNIRKKCRDVSTKMLTSMKTNLLHRRTKLMRTLETLEIICNLRK